MDTSLLTARFLQAQLAGDRREALRLVVDEGVERGASIHDIHLNIIKPAQYEIGRLWHENEISVAQEHLATSVAQLALSYLYRFLKRSPSNGFRMIVACVEGETHEVGARMIADLYESFGFDVWYLGANVPTESLLQMVKNAPPDIVALSAVMTFNLPNLLSTARVLRAAAPLSTRIVAGGQAASNARVQCGEQGLHVLNDDSMAGVYEMLILMKNRPLGAVEAHT